MSDTSSDDANIKELAKLLELRRKTGNHTVLLLGSRVGGLFRSEQFYEHLKEFSNLNFSELSRFEQFSECYAVLTTHIFGESDIHGICRTALQKVSLTDADFCLAKMIRNGLFEEIISTNIDATLEKALLQIGMTEGKEFDVCTAQRGKLRENPISCRITKVFGDFVARDYTINKRSAYIERGQDLDIFLRRVLERNLLVIGIDPVWDVEILYAIAADAGTMWFVSEEDLTHHARISSILRGRAATTVSEKAGRFDTFIEALYESIYEESPSRLKHEHMRNHHSDSADDRQYLDQLHDILDMLQCLLQENQQILSEIRKIKDRIENA